MADISQIKLPNGDIFDLVDGSKSTATNWVNGSQAGSVRTTGSTEEGSSWSSYIIGVYAIAEGRNTKANGPYSHAEGNGAQASGVASHAEGGGIAKGDYSHAEGSNTSANGSHSHAEGLSSMASGRYSHAQNRDTIAQRQSQTVIGEYNIADTGGTGVTTRGNYAFIIGNGSQSTRSNALTIDWSGNEWLAGKLTLGTAGTESMDVATIGQLPTKTSDLTNDSGFITSDSDEKLKLEAVANGIYYPIVGKDAAASVRQYDTTGLSYQFSNGTTTATGVAKLILGNNTSQGTAGNKEGRIKLFGPSSGSVELYASTSTQNRLIKFPDQDGTVALTSDIPTVSYPVTSVNSKTGAVSLTASDVGALASNTTYVSTITTTAGTHTAISKKSGAVSFNVPTKTSHLTNDSGYVTSSGVTSITLKAGSGISLDTDDTAITTTGIRTISHADTSSQVSSSNSGRTYIQSITLDTYGHVTGISTATESVTNTDTKLQVAAVTSGTQYYPIVGTGTSAATRQYDTTGFKYKGTNGTTSTIGSAILELGNSTASGTANNKQAQLIMYGSNAKKATITLAAPSADVAVALPTSSGTLALTSQIPSISVTQKTTTGTNIADVTVNGTTTQLFAPNGGGGDHEDLTQAEYDALTETEKKDGTVYFITDGVSDTVFVDDPNPIGAIQAYGGSAAPYGWLICDGRAVSRTTYSELFAVIGTTYGSGDGTSTFNLPDLQGRVAIGKSASYELGTTGGEATHTLTTDEMPSHKHTFTNSYGWTGDFIPGASATISGTNNILASPYHAYTGSTNNLTINTSGGSQSHNNMQPYIVTNYIIKAKDGGSVKPAILELIDTFYPVGSYYETTDTTFDPNIAWGGAWSLETEGQVHISGGSTYTVGNEYGRNETTLNANIGAANSNSASLGYITNAPTAYQAAHSANYVIQGSTIGFSGWNHSTPVTEEYVNSKNVSMMQKSIAVNRWHRIA